LLNDVDITSDSEVKHAIYLQWVDATCQSKRAKVQQAIGGSDTSVATSVYSSCMKRLQAQESNGGASVATGPSTNSGPTAGIPPSKTMPNVSLPQGCTSPPVPSNDFKTDKPITYPTPSTEAWTPDPKWVELNANSSGGEISTKSTVWLGYINRLRYNVTLGGVVTSIAAPTIPNSIFPTATPAPASKGATKPPTPGALVQPPPTIFDRFNTCFQQIYEDVVDFQGKLADEEVMLNNTRVRIENHIDSLQPIANTIEEARAAADYSILPKNEIPAFPIGDVVQLRGLLTEFISKYAEFAQWASADPWSASEFQRVSTGAASTAQALDKYLASSSTSATTPNTRGSAATRTNTGSTGAGTTNSSSASSGAVTNGTSTTGGTQGGSGGGTGPVATSQGVNKKKPKAKDKNSNAGQSGTGDTAGAATGGTGGPVAGTGSGAGSGTGTGSSQGSGANAGTGTSTGATLQATSPSAIDVGSQEVQNYEANREYISKWSDSFRKVAVAPAGYFIATYKPQCGGWFGQGTSTQMQLTVVDNTNPSQNSTPKNLDKVVCQSALTVTNGLGLSFIPDRTPAFVPSMNTGTNGTPVLGYSSVANVRPGYAVQVNGAFWSQRESNFEIHWSLGAMLTAATGGATTDIITGPSFSFKKRAFFISPVYDLGLRTVLQSGFSVGTPQGVLTSPPTQQTWKSGFGLTITFPLSPGSSTTNSSNSAGNSGASTAGSGTTGSSNSKKGNKANSNTGSNSGGGGTTQNP